MNNDQNRKRFDLEERTLSFAKAVLTFTKQCDKSLENIEITKQLIRSSCSIGANYIEANESLSKKDFSMRIKICCKEAKETRYWLNLISFPTNLTKEHTFLFQESTELMKIFGAIVEKTK